VGNEDGQSGEALLLVHHHPGRLRVRADGFRAPRAGAPASDSLEQARAAVAALPSVTSVTANPFTGSLLIEYLPGQVEPGAILAVAARAAGLAHVTDVEAERRQRRNLGDVVTAAARELDRVVVQATEGRHDLRTVVPLALFAGAAWSFMRQPEIPRWDNLLWWGYSVLHQRKGREGES
jgi:hypothetical protein